MKKSLLFILFPFLLFACKKEEKAVAVMLKFAVEFPSNTPSEDGIYIAGNFESLGGEGWAPDSDFGKMQRDGSTAFIEIELPNNLELPFNLNYKYSRGSWESVEKGAGGEEISNRSLEIESVDSPILIEDVVANWADVSAGSPNSNVVGNLDIVDISDDNFPFDSQKKRKVRIWAPSSYDKTKEYPLIVMHDGQNLFDPKTSFSGEWGVDEALANLMEENDFGRAIVVGVDNSSQRMGEYVYNLDFLSSVMDTEKTGDYYMDFIINTVLPYAEENYNLKKGRENRAIAGSSLGGLISLFGGLEKLDEFGSIIAFSTSTQLVDEENIADYFAEKDNELLINSKYFFYVGTRSDGDEEWPERFKNYLTDAGVPSENIEVLAGKGYSHNEQAWRKHLPIALKWLYGL